MDFNKPQNKKQNEKEVKPQQKETKSDNFLTDDEMYDLFMNEDITHIIEIPLFPQDFYHYQGSKRISDAEINEWVEECVLYLEQEQDEQIATYQSGDAKVLVMKCFDDADQYHYVIDIYRDRHTIEIAPQEI